MAPEPRRQASALEVAKAVVSAFLGIRRSADHDAIRFNPIHLVVAAIVAAAVFVVSLIQLVKFIVGRAG